MKIRNSSKMLILLEPKSGCSAVGSVPRSGRGGRPFESDHPDKSEKTFKLVKLSLRAFLILKSES